MIEEQLAIGQYEYVKFTADTQKELEQMRKEYRPPRILQARLTGAKNQKGIQNAQDVIEFNKEAQKIKKEDSF